MKSYLASLNLDKTAPGLAVAKVFVREILKISRKRKMVKLLESFPHSTSA